MCYSSSSLVLSLKTQVIPAGSLPPRKISFRHNVTLIVSLTVGTPPQSVSLVLDTGSELSWLRCNKSTQPAPVFDPLHSSSFSPVSCTSPTCTKQTRDFILPVSCDTNQLCHATLSYGDASSSEGNLATETFRFGGLPFPKIVFGCMKSSYSSRPEEDLKAHGILGMNRGLLSFASQMRVPKFSYCISDRDSSGVLLFGETSMPWLKPRQYTPLVQMSTPLPYFDRVAYSVQLEGIRVSDRLLSLPKSVFLPDHTGGGQTMVDSGTQFTFLLGPVYTALKNEFLNQTKSVLKVLHDPHFVFEEPMDLCYLVPLSQKILPKLPTVTLLFRGAEMVIYGDPLLYRVPGKVIGKDSVYCFTFGNSDVLGSSAFIIGHHHQQNIWVEYDLEKLRMGFAPTQCDMASKRLGLNI